MTNRTVASSDVERLMAAYPRIFFACHQRHVRDPEGPATLSANQASVLSHLDGTDPTMVSELAGHMGVSVSTMSLSLKRLERQGYVRRDTDPDDRRVVNVRLTEAGERMRGAQSVLEPELVEGLLGELESHEREAALRGMETLARAADGVVRERGARAFGGSRARRVG